MPIEELLTGAFVYLAAAVIAVPLFARLGLGSVLGYLVAGVLIGPCVLGFVGAKATDVMHFAEFGVIMMLFLVGLELQPVEALAAAQADLRARRPAGRADRRRHRRRGAAASASTWQGALAPGSRSRCRRRRSCCRASTSGACSRPRPGSSASRCCCSRTSRSSRSSRCCRSRHRCRAPTEERAAFAASAGLGAGARRARRRGRDRARRAVRDAARCSAASPEPASARSSPRPRC